MKSICATLLSAVFLLSLSPASAQDGEAPTNQELLERIKANEKLLDEQEEVLQEHEKNIENLKKTLLPNIQPVGSLVFMASEKPPAGYLYCDGSARNRTEFSELFATIGETWGKGNGNTTFNIPDLRGDFIRVWSKGGTVDAGRRLGQVQGQSTAIPSARFATAENNNTTVGGDQQHQLQFVKKGSCNDGYQNESDYDNPVWIENPNKNQHCREEYSKTGLLESYVKKVEGSKQNPARLMTGSHTHNITGGDPETRPRNQALACYIKAYSHSAF